jgi:MarR family transcriptional regulator, organic hydroperoxide resistance regulator
VKFDASEPAVDGDETDEMPQMRRDWREASMARRAAHENRSLAPRAHGAAARTIDAVTATRPFGAALEFLRSLWGVNHALESSSRRMKMRLGVTGPERMVVRLVGRYPEIAAGELAAILRVHPSTLTGLLKRLVKRGILVRRSDAGDGRRALFSLTERGRMADRVKSGTVEAAVSLTLQTLPRRDVFTAATVLDALQRELGGSGPDPL